MNVMDSTADTAKITEDITTRTLPDLASCPLECSKDNAEKSQIFEDVEHSDNSSIDLPNTSEQHTELKTDQTVLESHPDQNSFVVPADSVDNSDTGTKTDRSVKPLSGVDKLDYVKETASSEQTVTDKHETEIPSEICIQPEKEQSRTEIETSNLVHCGSTEQVNEDQEKLVDKEVPKSDDEETPVKEVIYWAVFITVTKLHHFGSNIIKCLQQIATKCLQQSVESKFRKKRCFFLCFLLLK